MSTYQFLPSPTFGVSEEPFVTWRDGFTSNELDQIISYGDSLPLNKAVIGGRSQEDSYTDIRESKTSWISLNNDSQWIYDKLSWIARQLNGQFYKFDLFGFQEDFQYTIYNAEDSGHYDWHQDSGSANFGSGPRKLSLVLQLSNPDDYAGGDLELLTASRPTKVEKQRGLIALFPSYTLHRVTAVTSGTRRSLVVWITGPAFK
jgi:PKHD-type hydroxylase